VMCGLLFAWSGSLVDKIGLLFLVACWHNLSLSIVRWSSGVLPPTNVSIDNLRRFFTIRFGSASRILKQSHNGELGIAFF